MKLSYLNKLLIFLIGLFVLPMTILALFFINNTLSPDNALLAEVSVSHIALLQQQAMLFHILSIVLVFVAGLVYITSIVTPINKLSKAAFRIMNGEYDHEMPLIKSGDEIEYLSKTMNLMVEALKQMKEEVSKKDKSSKKNK